MMNSRCAALDRLGNECCTVRMQGTNWCERHNRERIALYGGYKLDHKALESFPEESICLDFTKIRVGSSVEVKKWNDAIRSKRKLLNRCIDARARFSERFFGKDMDFGHRAFHQNLLEQRKELEACLALVEQRAYALILAAQNALWALERQEQPVAVLCPEPSNHTIIQPHRESIDLEETVDFTEDPLDTLYKAKVDSLRAGIHDRLARLMAPVASPWHVQRRDILRNLIRRIVFRDESLMVLAQRFDNVATFLDSGLLDPAALQKIKEGINDPDVNSSAAGDILRANKEGERVLILGGYIYRNNARGFLVHELWYHHSALGACYYCLRRTTCETVDQIIEFDKFYTFFKAKVDSDSVNAYLDEPSRSGMDSADSEHHVEMAQLRLCGVTPFPTKTGDAFTKIQEYSHYSKKKPHWEEIHNYNQINFGLSLLDPRSEQFLRKCLQNDELSIMWRRGPDGPISEPDGGLHSSKFRRAATNAQLKYASWTSKSFRTTVLEESYYPLEGEQRLGEYCYQLSICDKVIRPYREFLQCFVRIGYEVYAPGSTNPLDFFTSIAKYQRGLCELMSRNGEFVPSRVKDAEMGRKLLEL